MHASPAPPMTWTLLPDLAVLALRTPTLPPATATNTVFFGEAPFIVDPATPYQAEREALLGAVARLSEEGRAPRAIVLTHHHPDHVGAAAWLRDQAGLPVLAHARTAELLEGVLTIDAHLQVGERLGPFVVHHTPGHASGHVVLHDPERGLLIAGDMVASVGTIIVDPPDGHMASYLASLRFLRGLAAKTLVPSHGAPITGAREVEALLTHYLAHREEREALVLAALSRAPLPLERVTRAAYAELAAPFLPLAMRSALAHLEKLVEEGRAESHDEGWSRAGHSPS